MNVVLVTKGIVRMIVPMSTNRSLPEKLCTLQPECFNVMLVAMYAMNLKLFEPERRASSNAGHESHLARSTYQELT